MPSNHFLRAGLEKNIKIERGVGGGMNRFKECLLAQIDDTRSLRALEGEAEKRKRYRRRCFLPETAAGTHFESNVASSVRPRPPAPAIILKLSQHTSRHSSPSSLTSVSAAVNAKRRLPLCLTTVNRNRARRKWRRRRATGKFAIHYIPRHGHEARKKKVGMRRSTMPRMNLFMA